MSIALKVFGYELNDVLRGRWIVAYVAFFLLLTEALLRFGGTGGRALLSLMNVVLLVIPLMSLVFAAIHLYGARAFTELLLAQPVKRAELFGGLFLGLAVPLALAFVTGVSLPFVVRAGAGSTAPLLALLATGIALTFIFVSIAFLVTVHIDDRARGLGTAVLLWLILAVIYDGVVLLLAGAFADYPLEKPMLALMIVNPLDLGRVILLMSLDAAALMGYTGAVFARFFGSAAGAAIAGTALMGWIALPLALALRQFRRRDF